MGKYVRYNLVADCGSVSEHFESYREAFVSYHRCDAPKTLYGWNECDEPSVIFSKG